VNSNVFEHMALGPVITISVR